MTAQIPEPLFILEMANNHMGDVEHGVALIRAFAEVCKPFPFRFAFKMQYRQLDTFIHPAYKDRADIKYIKRFSETRVSKEALRRMIDEFRAHGFLPICTPFDPESVDRILEDGFEILKIASCSFSDWPLLERMVQCDLPIIASTATVSVAEIDNVVSFLEHRDKNFALMHCVAEYPTPNANHQLNQIDFLRHRYPHIKIGFSTHEEPNDTNYVGMAIAKGCRLFEKHVGLPTERYQNNGYSASPAQVEAWLTAAARAFEACGIEGQRVEPSAQAVSTIHSLRRGVFARTDLQEGQRIRDEDVFMAIPVQEGHITANDWSKYHHYYATRPIAAGAPILGENTRAEAIRQTVYAIVDRVKELLQAGKVVVPGRSDLEISHHYGIERFHEFGICMITVVNRQYCKKLIVVLPGQSHPEQYHQLKDETFHVLHGDVRIVLNGQGSVCAPGDVINVEKGVRHAFSSEGGAVIEEISTTHAVDDSFYTDPAIAQNRNRKTFVSFWLNP
ncbi:MAG: N-acetylneuraminate synthase family protein [Magnetococcales bacterium]|nr:N-acetylneuraminate synthase family protein [Magnetococcales bacterium]